MLSVPGGATEAKRVKANTAAAKELGLELHPVQA